MLFTRYVHLPRGFVLSRIGLTLTCLVFEVLVLTTLSTGKYFHLASTEYATLQPLVWLPLVVRAVAGAIIILLLAEFLRPRINDNIAPTTEAGPKFTRQSSWWWLNGFCVVLLCIILSGYERKWDAGPLMSPTTHALFLLTPVLWLCTMGSWIALTIHSIRSVNRFHVLLFFTALTVSFPLDVGIASQIGAFLLPTTLMLVKVLLGLVGVDLISFPPSATAFPIAGTTAFRAEIGPLCAGYQGIVLSLTLLGFSLFYLRPRFTIYRMTIVLLTSIAALYLLNSLRIAILIYIGSYYSSEIAVQGFHTNSGLLSALLTSLIATAVLTPKRRDGKVFSGLASEQHIKSQHKYLANVYFLLPLTLR